jgi:hypothetical protein
VNQDTPKYPLPGLGGFTSSSQARLTTMIGEGSSSRNDDAHKQCHALNMLEFLGLLYGNLFREAPSWPAASASLGPAAILLAICAHSTNPRSSAIPPLLTSYRVESGLRCQCMPILPIPMKSTRWALLRQDSLDADRSPRYLGISEPTSDVPTLARYRVNRGAQGKEDRRKQRTYAAFFGV